MAKIVLLIVSLWSAHVRADGCTLAQTPKPAASLETVLTQVKDMCGAPATAPISGKLAELRKAHDAKMFSALSESDRLAKFSEIRATLQSVIERAPQDCPRNTNDTRTALVALSSAVATEFAQGFESAEASAVGLAMSASLLNTAMERLLRQSGSNGEVTSLSSTDHCLLVEKGKVASACATEENAKQASVKEVLSAMEDVDRRTASHIRDQEPQSPWSDNAALDSVTVAMALELADPVTGKVAPVIDHLENTLLQSDFQTGAPGLSASALRDLVKAYRKWETSQGRAQADATRAELAQTVQRLSGEEDKTDGGRGAMGVLRRALNWRWQAALKPQSGARPFSFWELSRQWEHKMGERYDVLCGTYAERTAPATKPSIFQRALDAWYPSKH